MAVTPESIGVFHAVAAPWPDAPTDPQYRDAGAAAGIAVDASPSPAQKSRLNQIFGLMTEQINNYLNGGTAPVAVYREAYSRLWNFAKEAPSGAQRQVDYSVSSAVNFNQAYNFPAAMRASGCKYLLRPYRLRGVQTARHDSNGD